MYFQKAEELFVGVTTHQCPVLDPQEKVFCDIPQGQSVPTEGRWAMELLFFPDQSMWMQSLFMIWVGGAGYSL